jgi:hypothetical protein
LPTKASTLATTSDTAGILAICRSLASVGGSPPASRSSSSLASSGCRSVAMTRRWHSRFVANRISCPADCWLARVSKRDDTTGRRCRTDEDTHTHLPVRRHQRSQRPLAAWRRDMPARAVTAESHLLRARKGAAPERRPAHTLNTSGRCGNGQTTTVRHRSRRDGWRPLLLQQGPPRDT